MIKLELNGFTIVELIITISVIGILTTVGLVSYSAYVERGRNNQNKLLADEVVKKLEIWRTSCQRYPQSLQSCCDEPCSVEAESLESLLTSSAKERLVAGQTMPPSQEHPSNMRLSFCYRNSDLTTPVGAKVYYWDYQLKNQDWRDFGNATASGVICQ